MTEDARFEDGGDQPLRLMAETVEDVEVISSLLQDAILTGADMSYDRKRRELALLLNRFRWEDQTAAESSGRAYERVRTVLIVGDVASVASQGVDRSDSDLVLSVLSLGFEPGEDGAGEVLLTLAGDGAIRAAVECINLTLRDVTRPYLATSGKRPHHPD